MQASTVYTKPVYIFLDFDGVIHANDPTVLAWPQTTKDRGQYRYAFHQSDLLEFTLKRHAPNARIIVSSTWRTVFNTVEDLRYELLGSGCNVGLLNRMVGMTPVFKDDDEHVDPTVGTRLQEILAYIKEHELDDVPCLIVDDDCFGFTGKKGLFFPIVMPEAETGFSFKDAEETAGLITKFADEIKPKKWFWRVKDKETPKDESETDPIAA